MADDKSNTGTADRRRVAGGEQYEVAYFAAKHGIPADEARKIISKAGPSREKADSAAEEHKRR